MMQQVLSRVKLSATSLVPNFEQLTLTKLLITSLTQSKFNYNSVKGYSEKQFLKKHINKTKPLLASRQKTKKRFERNIHCSTDIWNPTTKFLNNSQRRENHLLHSFSSCAQCCRTFSTVCSNKHLLAHQRSAHIHVPQHARCVWDIYNKINFGNYSVLNELGEVCEPHHVPAHIKCPPYAASGQPPHGPHGPEVKAEWQVDAMRKSCHIARSILNAVGENIQVGMSTEEIDALVHDKIIKSGAYPSPLNYHGFPKSVCTSVNNVACHGIPNNRQLVDGDIISVDVTVFYNGYHGDCCETYLIGNVDEAGRHLVNAARRCRDESIAICGPGVPFSDIGAKVEEVAKREGVTVVPCFVGHGIGQYFHGPPDIYHCYNSYPGTMEDGMTFTIEPIVAQGSEEVLILEDGWTAVMVDNGRASQFEHTILITEKGHEILSEYY